MTPCISVIIPVYNTEKYIAQCLDSILNQTFQDFEAIVVDDGSTDGSVEIIEHYIATDSRICLIRQEQNKGPMVARQEGCNISKGCYIFFCDGDDTLPNNAFELLYNTAILNNADIVVGHINIIDANGNVRLFRKEELNYGVDSVSVYKSLLNGELSHNLCAKLFKKELLKEHQYLTVSNMRNGEDALLFYQIVEHCSKITCVENCVYNYIQHSTSSTHIPISLENVDKLMFLQHYLLTNIIAKYKPIERVGTKVAIERIIYWWCNTPHISRYEMVKIISHHNLWNLLTIKSLVRYCGIGSAICMWGKIFIEYGARKIVWLVRS